MGVQVAYSYTRLSTAEQLRGDGLRRQSEPAEVYSRNLGLVLDDTYRDLGVSGFTGENRDKGALSKFLGLVKTGKIKPGSHLIVESLDRLSRDQVLEALEVFLAIVRAGITIHTLADRQVYSRESIGGNPMLLMLSISEMARAHSESALKSTRLAAAWANKRKNALDRKLTRLAPHWLTLADDRSSFVVIEERAAIVRRIFNETANGIGKRKVAERLNRDRVPPPSAKGNGWHPSYIQKLLNDRSVLGSLQLHRIIKGKRVPVGDPIFGYYPAIVDEELYARAQAYRATRRSARAGGRKGETISNLFSGLCICWECQGTMTYRDKGLPPKGGRYLACDNATRGLGCSNKAHFPYPQLEAAVLEHVTEFDYREIIGTQPDRIRQLELEIAALAMTIDNLRRKQSLLIGTFENDAVPAVALRIREIQQEISDAERILNTKRQELDTFRLVDAPPQQADLISRLRAQLGSAEVEDRFKIRAKMAQAIRTMIDCITFDGIQGTADVVILAGLRAYRFAEGNLIAVVDCWSGLDTTSGVPRQTFTFGQPSREELLRKLAGRQERKYLKYAS